MDVHSRETRSYNMSQIRSKNTKPEEIVRKYLFSCGLRYKKMIRDCQDIRTLYCPNIKQLFLLMVAFGMCMRDVNILNGLRVKWTSGKKN